MRPDINYLTDKFKFYNDLCFEGELPVPVIRLNRRMRSLGLTCTRVDRLTRRKTIWIEISVYYDFPEEEYTDTLIHEMIHYKIAVKGIKDTSTHGKYFISEMERIRRDYGITVTSKFRDSNMLQTKAKPVSRFFCITMDTEGNSFVTVAAKSRIFQLWDSSEALKRRGFSIKWYLGRHTLLIPYPRSQSLKLYKIDSARLEDLMSVSKPLIREGSVIRVSNKQ